ncbi:MAG: cupin domain-containing protein [Chloroflexi bacterium]|nr:cupin domain-containing protein [Chloroflexota bacterium]
MMDAFDMSEIEEGHRKNGELYHEFFKAERRSIGLYACEAGATDPQVPHTEDEIYYIVSGTGMIEVAGEHRPVSAGSVIYVGVNVDHRFHSITEDLSVIVVFAPPRRSLAVQS